MINAVGIKARKNASRRHSCSNIQRDRYNGPLFRYFGAKEIATGPAHNTAASSIHLASLQMIFPRSLLPCRNERTNDLRLRVLFVFCDGIGHWHWRTGRFRNCDDTRVKTRREVARLFVREKLESGSVSTSRLIFSEIDFY